MKAYILFVVFLFITFLSLPTIISMIESDKIDISMAFNMCEEEEVQEKSPFKELVNSKKNICFFYHNAFINKLIFSCPDNKYVSVLDEIFSPPPEM